MGRNISMARRAGLSLFILGASICGIGWVQGCGSSDNSGFPNDNPDGSLPGDDSGIGFGNDGGFTGSDGSVTGHDRDFQITPVTNNITVHIDGVGKNAPVTTYAPSQTIQFNATVGGVAATPVWSVVPAELGSIDASGLFKANGIRSGTAIVSASYQGSTKYQAQIAINIKVVATQNGAPDNPGGGGVGGNPLGGQVGAPAKGRLDNPTASNQLGWLYPYNGTVWPRGLFAPLLQWSNGSVKPTAV